MKPAPTYPDQAPFRNQVLTGDVLNELRQLPSNLVDGVSTDPPYNSGGRQTSKTRNTLSKSTRRDEDWILSDSMGPDTYLWWMREVAAECFRLTKAGGHAHVFTDWRQFTLVVTAWESAGWTLRSVMVWDKNKGSSMGSFWRNNHEWCIILTKGKSAKLPHGGYFNTWKENKPHGGAHPNEKPIGLMRYLVSSHAPKGKLILDPFSGSGTTCEACALEGHDVLAIDKDPVYAQMSRDRLAAVLPAPPTPEPAPAPLFNQPPA